MDSLSPTLLQSVFLGSATLFAGMGVTVSVVAVPAILESSDPLPAFRKLYNQAKKIVGVGLVPSVISGLLLYVKLDDRRYLMAATCNILVIPVTALLIMPINNVLFALKEGKAEDNRKAKKLLASSWSTYQWVRTLLGLSAYAIGVYAILDSK